MSSEAPAHAVESPSAPAAPPDLAAEAALFARYITGREGAGAAQIPQIAARYAAGCELLFPGPAPAEDHAVLEFVRRRPWSLPFLDAALALVRPEALLRRKLILVLSILETLPENASLFAPRPRPRWRVIASLAALGLASAFKAAAGLALWPLVRGSR